MTPEVIPTEAAPDHTALAIVLIIYAIFLLALIPLVFWIKKRIDSL